MILLSLYLLFFHFSAYADGQNVVANTAQSQMQNPKPLSLTRMGDRNVGANFVGRSQVIAEHGMDAYVPTQRIPVRLSASTHIGSE